MTTLTPTIKGIFLKSHINAVKQAKGEEGIKQLEETYGKPLSFKNSDDIPVREEVKLIEVITQLLSTTPISPEQLPFEAGKQHFRDFTTTPLAKIVLPFFKNQFKQVVLQAQNIAGHVFQGVTFETHDEGEKKIKLIMRNNDYPIDHFKGFFQAWMEYSGLQGTIEAKEINGAYEYLMSW